MSAALDLVRRSSSRDDPQAEVFESRIVDAILRAYTTIGDFDAAYSYAEGLRSSKAPELYESALDTIVHAEARAGNIAKALQLIDSGSVSPTPSLLLAIADSQARAGDTGDARRTLVKATTAIRAMREDAIRVIVMTSAARVMSRLGDSADAEKELLEALAIAKGIGKDVFRAVSLSAIALTHAQSGALRTALSIARSIEYNSFRASALCGIIRVAAIQSRSIETDQVLAEALTAAQGDDFPSSRAGALGTIAELQAFLKNHEAAERTIKDARRAADAAESTLVRSAALHAVALHQAGLGDVRGALTTTLDIDILPERILALLGIATVLAGDNADSP